MQIFWYGQSCFKIISGPQTLILAPFKKSVGLTPPRGKADILILNDSSLSKDDVSQIEAGFTVAGAGEYEMGGTYVNGMSVVSGGRVSTMYIISIEDMRICHLSNMDEEHTLRLLDKIGQIDLLMISIGGQPKTGKDIYLNDEEAMKIIREIDPRVIIPMNFKVPKLNIDLAGPEKFLKAVGAQGVGALDKYTIKKRDLPLEGREVILLKTE